MKLLIIMPTLFAFIFSDELSDCKCKEGYYPQKDGADGVYCHGVILKSILPCNLILKPNCICNNETTSVVQDSTGTWCGKFVDGKSEKRWDCENKDEWDAFFKEHPEEKP